MFEQGRSRRLAGIAALIAVTAVCVTSDRVVPPARALGNGLAVTPPMGWNDWNQVGCNVSESLVVRTADAMVGNGMRASGYKYVNVDDCWALPTRDSVGNLVPNPATFPHGIKAVADYVHSKGLKFGIYLDAGTRTCSLRGGFTGSLGHERQDARTLASWGVDYLKYDNCNNGGSTTVQEYISRYSAMRDALATTRRPIVYSISEWGINHPWTWAPKVGNLWRTTGDIHDSYDSMIAIFHANSALFPYAKRGAWNDPDMLEIGNGGMTTTEYRTEFSLWSEMAAPLIAGTDLVGISAANLAILTNRDVIAVDQDPLGKQGVPVSRAGGHWVLSKKLANGDHAVVLFNETATGATIATAAAKVGMPHTRSYRLRNLWSHHTAKTAGTIRAAVPAHGVAMYRVTPLGRRIAPRSALYEAESPLNKLRGGARTGVCPACSGGLKVGWVGRSGTLTFTHVYASNTRKFAVIIAYCDGSRTGRQATISVNGANARRLSFVPTGSFTRPGNLTVRLHLRRGNNSITFANRSEYAPDFDKITVSLAKRP
jgi:alpha-galactosidase